jgi:hypothetical protein
MALQPNKICLGPTLIPPILCLAGSQPLALLTASQGLTSQGLAIHSMNLIFHLLKICPMGGQPPALKPAGIWLPVRHSVCDPEMSLQKLGDPGPPNTP